jgi:hypothetical protein
MGGSAQGCGGSIYEMGRLASAATSDYLKTYGSVGGGGTEVALFHGERASEDPPGT